MDANLKDLKLEDLYQSKFFQKIKKKQDKEASKMEKKHSKEKMKLYHKQCQEAEAAVASTEKAKKKQMKTSNKFV